MKKVTWPYMTLVVILFAASALAGQSLGNYAAACDLAIGESVPAFNCNFDGVVIPQTNLSGGFCDKPNRLNRVCDPNSKFINLKSTASVEIVALCRSKGGTAGFYGDIAVIQHNKINGATCFYQALSNTAALSGAVDSPKFKIFFPWLEPSITAGIQCHSCHDTGPFIRSPYLSQLTTPPHVLPGASQNNFNKTSPYFFVGPDFASWRVFSVSTPPPANSPDCTSCHRMGMSNGALNLGTSRDLGLRATATSEQSKNPHNSTTSPIWMLPGQNFFSQSSRDSAQKVANCALEAQTALQNGTSLPERSDCSVVEYGRSFSAPAAPLLSISNSGESLIVNWSGVGVGPTDFVQIDFRDEAALAWSSAGLFPSILGGYADSVAPAFSLRRYRARAVQNSIMSATSNEVSGRRFAAWIVPVLYL
jgi:hypothetical protein